MIPTFPVAAAALFSSMVLVASVASETNQLLPVGTITGALVTVLVVFLRSQARNDTRQDVISARMVAAAEAERDRVRAEMQITLKFLYDRIAHLEAQLYGEVITQRPPETGADKPPIPPAAPPQ